jgi:hypothetical protein
MMSPELAGRPGLWRFTREFAPRPADVFVMLFCNLYSTNFAQWIEGTWSSRVRILAPCEEESAEESLIGGSWEARNACLAAACDAPPGSLPPSAVGLGIARAPVDGRQPADTGRGLLVTAFGPNPYGDGTLLRLWDQAGHEGRHTIGLPAGLKARAAQPGDVRGRTTGAPLRISDRGTLDVTIRRMAPTSLILQTEPPTRAN